MKIIFFFFIKQYLAGLLLFFALSTVSHAQQLKDCIIDFDDPFSLSRLYRDARDTFAVNSESIFNSSNEFQGIEQCDMSDGGLCQYYYQFCGRGFFRVDPLEYGHYHLGGDNWDCYDGSVGGMGTLQGNTCVTPSNYAQVPRTLSSHASDHRIEIWQATADFNEGTERCEFDFMSLRILGTTPVRVEIVKSGVTYVWNSINPGHWDFSSWGEGALYVRLRAASGEVGPIQIDDIRTRG